MVSKVKCKRKTKKQSSLFPFSFPLSFSALPKFSDYVQFRFDFHLHVSLLLRPPPPIRLPPVQLHCTFWRVHYALCPAPPPPSFYHSLSLFISVSHSHASDFVLISPHGDTVQYFWGGLYELADTLQYYINILEYCIDFIEELRISILNI